MSENKRKILIIIPSMKGGGAERVLLNLFKIMDLDRYKIDLFIGVKGGILEEEIPFGVNINYIFRYRIIEMIASLFYRYTESNFLFKLFGRRINGNYSVGVCYINSLYSEFLFQTRGSILKKVIFLHSSYKTYSNKFKSYKGVSLPVLMERYNKLDVIVAVAHEALKEFRELYGEFEDTRVIYNPMNSERIKSKSISGSIPKEQSVYRGVKLIAIGSHIPVKGYDKLIRACAILKEKQVDYQLIVLGSGPLFKTHQVLIEELNLSSNIKLIGFVKNPYVWLKNSDIFVMTSFAEGLPTALCESLILGIPSVVTNAPGIREVVDYGKYGMMVEDSVQEIASGLNTLISEKETRSQYKKMAIKRSKIFNDNIALEEYYKIFDL